MIKQPIKAIVIGASAGGVEALNYIFRNISRPNIPILVVLHIAPYGSILTDAFIGKGDFIVKEAEDKEQLAPGVIYFAPPNYHLLVERDLSVSLSVDEAVQFSRPSIDVLFETAAVAFGKQVMGVLLTGANSDGARGLKQIHERGGMTIVQNPAEASFSEMPSSAINLFEPNHVLALKEMVQLINHEMAPRAEVLNEVSHAN